MWNLQIATGACQRWRVLECRGKWRKEKGVKKKIKKRAGQSRATKFILGAGRIATFFGQSHTLLQILLHKSPGQGIGIYLEIRLELGFQEREWLLPSTLLWHILALLPMISRRYLLGNAKLWCEIHPHTYQIKRKWTIWFHVAMHSHCRGGIFQLLD